LGTFDTLSVIDGSLRVGGDADLAINHPSRFDLVSGLLHMNGPNAGQQDLEAMATDVGSVVDLADATRFPIAVFRVGSNSTTVRLVDNHNNAPGAGREALYVGNLILNPGVTLDLNGCHLYYAGVTPADPFSPQSGVTIEDSAGGGGLVQIQQADDCPADLDHDGHVGLPDLGSVLAAFGLTGVGDIDGDLDTDLADLGALLAVFNADCPV
jgi:hypothetical protein